MLYERQTNYIHYLLYCINIFSLPDDAVDWQKLGIKF